MSSMPEQTAFGVPMLAHFQFDPAFTNLNHGIVPPSDLCLPPSTSRPDDPRLLRHTPKAHPTSPAEIPIARRVAPRCLHPLRAARRPGRRPTRHCRLPPRPRARLRLRQERHVRRQHRPAQPILLPGRCHPLLRHRLRRDRQDHRLAGGKLARARGKDPVRLADYPRAARGAVPGLGETGE